MSMITKMPMTSETSPMTSAVGLTRNTTASGATTVEAMLIAPVRCASAQPSAPAALPPDRRMSFDFRLAA